MRETDKVAAHYKGGFEAVEKIEKSGQVKHVYLPKLLIQHMKASVVKTWDADLVQLVAEALEKAIKSRSISDYKEFVKHAKKIPGMGKYSYEHLYRSACVMMGVRHPAKNFVEMGLSLYFASRIINNPLWIDI